MEKTAMALCTTALRQARRDGSSLPSFGAPRLPCGGPVSAAATSECSIDRKCSIGSYLFLDDPLEVSPCSADARGWVAPCLMLWAQRPADVLE